ncbi:MAG: 4-hydroxy-tetrahydrodipicolinate reductase [Caulobacteraceae bacterium]
MIKILMSGCNGKMGQTITRLSQEYEDMNIIAGITRNPEKINNPYPAFKSFSELNGTKADVVLDFSNPAFLPEVAGYCTQSGTALVVGTTGLSDTDYEVLRQASLKIPVFVSANMSFGISVLLELALKAASALGESYDIEILEKHHNEKKDAPSGTALMLADELNKALDNSMDLVFDRSKTKEKRKHNEIGISAIRGGTIPGEHTIFFAGKDEVLEIKHSALSRDVLGRGALRAVRYIASKKAGLYNMKSMLKELEQ